MDTKSQRVFLGITSIVILIVGIFLGVFLAANRGTIGFEAVKVGLSFSGLALLLIISNLMLEIKDLLQSKNIKKKLKI